MMSACAHSFIHSFIHVLYLQSTRENKIRNLLKEKFIPSVELSENVNYLLHTVHNDLIAIVALNIDDIVLRIWL